MLENNKKNYKEEGPCFDLCYLVEKSTESSQEFFLEEGDSRSCSVSVIRKEVLLRGVISLSSSWVELYAVCFLSCVPVWPCCLTTVVNRRSFFFETSLCFLSNSLGWFESKLVADCWCYCFEVLHFMGGLACPWGPGLWCHRCFDASKILSPLRGVLSQTRCLLHTIQCSLRQQVGPNPLLQICIFPKTLLQKMLGFGEAGGFLTR